VRHGDTRGIFFLAEWIPNRLAALIGPRTYGLPYRVGRLRYERWHRRVDARGRTLEFAIKPTDATDALATASPGTIDHFLDERYTAFTHRAGVTRRFDVDHVPWPLALVEATLVESTLLALAGDFWDGAELAVAHYSPGVFDVTMTPPGRLDSATSDQYSAACMTPDAGRMRTSYPLARTHASPGGHCGST
jgi:uncharacterized protein YqjF (DUF2071 family)